MQGLVFSFFSSPLTNTNNEKYTTETANIALKFNDNYNGVSGILNLGGSITKRFTLENTGTKDAYAKINWVNLINTYLPQSLSYTEAKYKRKRYIHIQMYQQVVMLLRRL